MQRGPRLGSAGVHSETAVKVSGVLTHQCAGYRVPFFDGPQAGAIVLLKPLASLALAVQLAAACASTQISSQTAPEALGRRYARVLVVFPTADLRERRLVEGALAELDTLGFRRPAKDATLFVESTALLFPGRAYSDQQTDSIISTNSIDAVLILSLMERGATLVGVAPSVTRPVCTTSVAGRCVDGMLVTSGGAAQTARWASFNAQLVDVRGNEVVWVASSRTEGKPINTSADVLRAMAKKVRSQLKLDGLVR